MKLSEYNLPPQGLKILCFRNGDCWTAYRFDNNSKSIWIACVPSCNLNPERQYQMGRCDEPDYWSEIPFSDLPREYTGRIMVKPEGDENFYTIDELQVIYPKEHRKFIKGLVWGLNKKKHEEI